MNSVHITTETTAYYSVAVDELPSATAYDCHEDIIQSVDNLAFFPWGGLKRVGLEADWQYQR